MTTNAGRSNPSVLSRVQQHLQARPGFRYAIAGAVLLVLALTQLIATVDAGTGFTGNRIVQLGMTAIGTALVVTGIVKARRR